MVAVAVFCRSCCLCCLYSNYFCCCLRSLRCSCFLALLYSYCVHFSVHLHRYFSSFGADSASIVVFVTAFYMMVAVHDLSYPGTSCVPVAVDVSIVCWLRLILILAFESCRTPKKNHLPTAHMLHLLMWCLYQSRCLRNHTVPL